MAEIGNEFPVQNQGVNIPGLANARVRNEEQENNRVSENRQEQNRINEQRRAEEAQNAANQQSDRITVAGRADSRANPGVAEQRALQANGELFIVPSQRVEPAREPEAPNPGETGRTISDLNQTARQVREGPQRGGPVGAVEAIGGGFGDPNLGAINDQIVERANNATPSLDRIRQEQQIARPDPVERQTSAQDRTVQRLTEEAADDGRGQGLAAQAPDNPVIQTPSQDVSNLTLDRAGLAGTNTGRPNGENASIRDAARESLEAQRERRAEESRNERDAERTQTERGRNVDRLI